MIIRKPYAFLIKYFKIIHIIIWIFITFMLFSTRNIYMFFKNYLLNGTYVYVPNMALEYVSIPMIITTIFLVGMFLLILLLMREKKKPILYYLTATIFYFLTFIFLMYFSSVLNNLEYIDYSNQAIVIFRDISMIFYYLNYYFFGIAFVRGFGFNIKKFNFEKDVKELDITDEDREEIELGLEVDYDNIFNFIRKRIRYFKYYLKENSFVLVVFLVIVLLLTTAYITIDNLLINKTYYENDVITIDKVEYTIKNSYITNKDSKLEYVKNENTNYLIINFGVINKNEKSLKLDINNSRLVINNKYYYPKTNVSNKFSDLGTLYKKQNLISNNEKDYILVFEIGNISPEKVKFELYNCTKMVNEQVIYYYEEIILKPSLFKENYLGNYKLMDVVNLEKTLYETGTFNLNTYELLDVFNYTYTKCDDKILNGKCTDYQASVVANLNKKILKMEYASSLENLNIFNYLSIKYKINDKEYIIKSDSIKNVTPDNYLENNILLEVSGDLNLASDIKFVFNIRGVVFEYETN